MAEDKKKKPAEGGGNPNVPEGAFGGARDATLKRLFPELSSELFSGPSFFDPNLGAGNLGAGGRGGGEGGGDQRKKLEAMVDMWREQLAAEQAMKGPEAVRKNLQSLAEYQDPVRLARERQEASLAAPFGPGGYFEGRRAADIMTPEEIMASQGRTAANQWASLRQPLTEGQKQNLQGPGGVKVAAQRGAGEFDPEELRRLNEQYRARRTYM
jgi:hypothetical protein